MQVVIAASVCLAAGLPPIAFDSYPLADAFIQTVAGVRSIDHFVSLFLKLSENSEQASALGNYLLKCLGTPS